LEADNSTLPLISGIDIGARRQLWGEKWRKISLFNKIKLEFFLKCFFS